MNKTIGLIGGGNMARAIIGGMLNVGLVTKEQVVVSDSLQLMLDSLSDKYGIRTTMSNTEVAQQSDILFLAVKPNVYAKVIEEIKDSVREDVIIITIAAGIKLESVSSRFGKPIKVVRTMPNTPALVGEGMAAICPNKLVTKEEAEEVASIFNSLGKSEIVDEYLLDVVTGLSGSSPAFIYMFIEAMSDAAVSEGMPRALSYRFAAQAVMGAAKMVLETGQHPGLLKDNVCSPGGTAIAGVCELENQGLRQTVISAVKASTARSREMDNN